MPDQRCDLLESAQIFTRMRQFLFQSFTQMFVKFLETESVPHQAPRLPMAAMINEAQRKRRTTTSHSGESVILFNQLSYGDL